jgi:hypothetical protein
LDGGADEFRVRLRRKNDRLVERGMARLNLRGNLCPAEDVNRREEEEEEAQPEMEYVSVSGYLKEDNAMEGMSQ